MSTRVPSPPRLPSELTAGMHRLARSGAEGSQPYPHLDRAIQRSHRRRVALASAAVAVAVAAGTGTAVTILRPGPSAGVPATGTTPARQSSPAPDSSAAGGPISAGTGHSALLRTKGYAGQIGGSLAGNTAFIQQIRARVAAIAQQSDGGMTGTQDDVLVFWAGDLGGQRIAVAGYQPPKSIDSAVSLALVALTGSPGDSPAHLTQNIEQTTTLDQTALTQPVSMTFADRAHDPDSGVVLVVAPQARLVQLAATRRFSPTGAITTGWQSLQKQGGVVWAGTASRNALLINRIQADGQELPASGSLVPLFDLTTPLVALAGPADRQVLGDARTQLGEFGVSFAEVPVIAGATSGGPVPLAAVVLRSPDNGYLAGFAGTPSPDGSALTSIVSSTPFATADDVLMAVDMPELNPGSSGGVDSASLTADAVVAPKQAVRVRAGSVTVTVHHRLALIPGAVRGVRVEALDAQGTVIATVMPQQESNASSSGSGSASQGAPSVP